MDVKKNERPTDVKFVLLTYPSSAIKFPRSLLKAVRKEGNRGGEDGDGDPMMAIVKMKMKMTV